MAHLARSALALGALFLLSACAADADVGEEAGEQSAEQISSPSATAPSTLAPGAFGFTSLDIGQGDAAVLVAPHGCVALLDAGPTGSGATIKQYLHSMNVARIDFALVSHFHEDHLGGIEEVEQGADAIPIGQVYDHGGTYHTVTYQQYDTQFAGRRLTAVLGQRISLCGEVTLEVVATNANGLATNDENAKSLVVKVSYEKLDVLVGGDVTATGANVESTIGAAIGPVELYKVHHHGSSGSTGVGFLDAITPTVSFISVAKNNSFGHPAPSTLSRLGAVSSAVWLTEGTAEIPRGHLELSSLDGNAFTVTQSGRSATYASK